MKVLVGVILFFLVGCADYAEVERVTFPATIGVDYDKESEDINIFTRVTKGISPVGEAGRGQRVIRGSGKTFMDALVETIDKNLQVISWKHSDVVLVSEDLAKRGLINELDLLYRLDEVLINAFLIITDEDIEDVFDATLEIETTIPIPLAGVAEIKKQSMHVNDITIMDFLQDYLKEGKDPIVPSLKFKPKIEHDEEGKRKSEFEEDVDLKEDVDMNGSNEDGDDEILLPKQDEDGEFKQDNGASRKEDKVLEFAGLGIFKEDKFVGNLSKEESMGVMMVFGFDNARGITISNRVEGEFDLVIDDVNSKTDIDTYLIGEGLGIRIDLDVRFNIAQHSIKKSIEYDEVELINNEVENYLEGVLNSLVFKLQNEFGTDTLGLGERVFRQNTRYWMEHKDRWDEIFPKVPIKVNVNAKLKSTGQLVDSFKKVSLEK